MQTISSQIPQTAPIMAQPMAAHSPLEGVNVVSTFAPVSAKSTPDNALNLLERRRRRQGRRAMR